MKRIIEEVLQAEERVGTLLERARAKAAEVRESVEKEISAKMGEAKLQSREMVRVAVEDAKKEAEGLREQRLKQADSANGALLNGNAEKMQGLVDDISRIILKTGCEKDL